MQHVDGSAQQQREGDQAKGDGSDQCRRCGDIVRRLSGRLDFRVLAAGTHEAWWTLTHGPGEVRVTSTAVVAGELVTGAAAHRAVLAGEAECACAGEVIDGIHAGAGIAAGVAGTVVNVGLAVGAGESGPTATHNAFTEIQTLSACIETEES